MGFVSDISRPAVNFFSAGGKLPGAQGVEAIGPRWGEGMARGGTGARLRFPGLSGGGRGVIRGAGEPQKKVTRLTLRRAGSPWEGDIWMHSVSGPEALWVADFF